jgi:hypothetical protein
VNLEDAIRNLVNTGFGEPTKIVEQIHRRFDEAWLAEQLLAYADDFIRDVAVREIGLRRRQETRKIRSGDPNSGAKVKVTYTWIPDVGYRPVGELTLDEVLARRDYYDRLIGDLAVWRRWWSEVADLMQYEAATLVKDLDAQLPPWPESKSDSLDVIELLEAA